MSSQKPRVIGVFALAMINLAVICTLRGLPILAEEGLSLIFYYAVAAVVFLIPVSLVTAELATGWPPKGPGGVYIWVREAFGERLGFIAVWLQWIQNVIWFPAVLSFLGATLAYIFSPALASNKFYMISVILTVYWAGVFASFRGMKTSSLISTIGVIAGVFLPGLITIGLAALWLGTGKGSQINFSLSGILPNLANIEKVALLAGAVLIFSGIEVSAVHAASVDDPKRSYPRAIFLSAAIALVVLVLGSLSIAIVVPQRNISLVAGIMEALRLFLDNFGLRWILPVVAALIAAGSIGEVCSWIVGPSKGLYTTTKGGNLPPFFHYRNKNEVPTHIIYIQAMVVSLLTLIFLFMPTVSAAYWILSALCVHLYLIMYIILYISAIRLRYTRPDVERAYKIPGGNIVMWLVGGIGILGALFAITVAFYPPSQFRTGNVIFYESFLIGGTLIMLSVPIIISFFKKSSWHLKSDIPE